MLFPGVSAKNHRAVLPQEGSFNSMKACMLAYTFYETDNRVRRYAEALVKRGDQVDAIALAREGISDCEVIQGVRVFRIQKRVIDERGPLSYLTKLVLFFIRSAWFLTIMHLRERYDIIHVHSRSEEHTSELQSLR